MTEPQSRWLKAARATLAAALATAALSATAQARNDLRPGDYIAVIVNQELVTAGEVERRLERVLADAGRGAKLPPQAELRKLALDALIDERVMITTARESGMRVDEPEIDRAVQSIAAQNQITLDALRERLRTEGTDYGRFRSNVRDQIMIERLREREVYGRIKISDEDIDRLIEQQQSTANAQAETNLAQILVTVAEDADAATVAARRALIDAALARVLKGEPFETVAREVSEDGNRQAGGVIGLRPAARLPDVFVEATKALKPGEVTAQPLRTGAGFHILKLVERKQAGAGHIKQTRARHVLLRTSPQLSAEVAARRLAEYRKLIETGTRSFEDIARQYSEDGSAAAGGDLGWSSPGVMVPEFENAMNEVAVGGLSAPVVSRFGVHLIQVLERRDVALDTKQLREQARNVLREQRFEQAYLDWTKELRSRAYLEYREPPQ
ncbi:peptidylprolyl isomerase [Brevundimonas sp.]|uniref:peptidylprolyl isomerase n=1 Tax=Brevundimonas sp. TaxID=1871086 RepID=UPI0027311091|nr:peptidylprolyl isomerase [Brevundimonas sp.]MDP1912256.1 peptidylprolyl isomerase [Brevundimonas sp.]